MYLQETDEQQALRRELRAYFAELLSPEVRADIGYRGEGGEGWRRIVKQMGTDGWLGIGWPKEFGGQGRPATDQFIFYDEVQRAKAPVPFVTLNTVGPTLMRYGSDEQKAEFLPKILAGEVNFAIGYSEPSAGTDLASLQTRAVRDGDEYVINGNKIFTSGANDADWVWLACRTDPEAKKHRGISMILIPTDAPGFSWTPIVTVGENRTTATYYDDVRVPVSNLVGEENGGWRMITTQLNHERIGLAAHSGEAHELFADVRDWAAENGVLAIPWVRADLAKCHALLDAMHLLNWQLTTAVANDELNPADASAVKVYGTESVVEVYHLLLGILGAAGYLRQGSPGAVLSGRVEQAGRSAQINTFGGGVNEIQREIVAWMGLGMTRGGALMAFLDELRGFEGREVGPPEPADDPVNIPMIRHWVEAMGDTNPVYLDEDAAKASGRDGVVAPAVMLQVWPMKGLKSQGPRGDDEQSRLMNVLDDAGFTSVVATNTDQEYVRELVPGDHLTSTRFIESVSEEKATGLGVGHFVTTRAEYRDQTGELVGSMMFRILKFKPREKAPAKPPRPRPSTNLDNAWWFEAAKEHRLVIQKCSSCGVLRHPPGPMCAACHSTEWEAVDASGKGTVYSFVTNHYPQVPSFDYPLNVSLIELEEGVRLVANVIGIEADAVEIGMAVEVEFVDHDDDLTLPAFRPVGG